MDSGNSPCSPEQVADSSRVRSSDGDASVRSRSERTAGKCYCVARETACFPCSLSGTMSEPSTDDPGVGRWISSLAGSRVRTSVAQEVESVSTGRDLDSGSKCPESFARYDRASSSWKTHQISLFEDSVEFSETWPRWGSMRAGECWELDTLAPVIVGIESGYWPTPTRGDAKGSGRRLRSSKAHAGTSLTDSVLGGRETRRTGKGLNPDWTEWLMGIPVGMTDLRPLALDKFQQWRRLHGGS